jgi:hypothetical protein
MRRLILTAPLLVTLLLLCTPPAGAGDREDCLTNECRLWFDMLGPQESPPRTSYPTYPSGNPPGTWQVYETPPSAPNGVGAVFCGIMPTQQPAPGCHPDWNYWYR